MNFISLSHGSGGRLARCVGCLALCLAVAAAQAGVPSRNAPEPVLPAESALPPDMQQWESIDPSQDAATAWPSYAEQFTGYPQASGNIWHWQLLPDGLIYQAYLAGVKESRMSSVVLHDPGHGELWDITLGGRMGMVRYGDSCRIRPEGWQLDVEGAAILRLDVESQEDLRSVDFRFGVPLTYAEGPYQTKMGYYHVSSHLGDEFMLADPAVQRLNYVREALVWGHGVYLTDELRLYGELDWAFLYDGGSKPLHVQFGADFAPYQTDMHGAPFAALNVYLQEDVDFGGRVTVQAGWAWRGTGNAHLLRVGLHWLNGKSPQFEFFDQSEQQIGLGIWYDY